MNANKDKKPKDSLAVINLENGEKVAFNNVSRFKFSEDSKWLVYVLNKDKKKPGKDKPKITGSDIVLRHLHTGSELPIYDVTDFLFDSLANYFV